MRKVFCLLFLLLGYFSHSQKPKEKPPRWFYDGFSFANLGTGEQHSYFSLRYVIDPRLQAELQGFYDTYRASDVFDASFRVRWYPSKEIYLFTGLGAQFEREKVQKSYPIIPLYITNGIGFEPANNFDIQVINEVDISGKGGVSGFLKVNGKYRF